MFAGKRKWILLLLVILGFIAGRLVFRGGLDLLLGGTLFGGNFL